MIIQSIDFLVDEGCGLSAAPYKSSQLKHSREFWLIINCGSWYADCTISISPKNVEGKKNRKSGKKHELPPPVLW